MALANRPPRRIAWDLDRRSVTQPVRHGPRLVLLAMVSLVAVVLVASLPPPAAGATYPVRMEAGLQTGYRFSSTGVVLESRTVTVVTPIATSTSERVWIPSRGSHIRPLSGPLAGWLVPESMVAYIRGRITTRSFAPPVDRKSVV